MRATHFLTLKLNEFTLPPLFNANGCLKEALSKAIGPHLFKSLSI